MTHKLAHLRDYPNAQTIAIGFLFGDIIGSPYEYPKESRITDPRFPLYSDESRFTDDTVLTMSMMKAMLHAKKYKLTPSQIPFEEFYREFARRYRGRAYGKGFEAWLKGESDARSYGNGASMRISPLAFAYKKFINSVDATLTSSRVTHNNFDALSGAMLVNGLLHYIYNNEVTDKDVLFRELAKKSLAHTRCNILTDPPNDESLFFSKNPQDYYSRYGDKSIAASNPSVPQAIACFFSSDNFEDTIRNAVALGCDADTQASIAGAIALPYYREMPAYFLDYMPQIPKEFCELLEQFSIEFEIPKIKFTPYK